MFWLRNKKNNFQLRTFVWRPEEHQLLLRFWKVLRAELKMKPKVESQSIVTLEKNNELINIK